MTEGENHETTLEGQVIDARVRRLAQAHGVSEERAEQALHAHKGDYDTAYEMLEYEAQHGQEGGGCHGRPFPCEECQQVDDGIREENQAQWEQAYEEHQRDQEREEREYSRPY